MKKEILNAIYLTADQDSKIQNPDSIKLNINTFDSIKVKHVSKQKFKYNKFESKYNKTSII